MVISSSAYKDVHSSDKRGNKQLENKVGIPQTTEAKGLCFVFAAWL